MDLVIGHLNEIKTFVNKFNSHNKKTKIELKVVIKNNSIDIEGIIKNVQNTAEIVIALNIIKENFIGGYFKFKSIIKKYSKRKSKRK